MKSLIKKIVAFIAALAMGFGTSALTAFAEDDPTSGVGKKGIITVNNATYNKEYKAYKIFDASFGSGNAVSYTTDAEHRTLVAESNVFDVSTAADSNGKYTVTQKEGVEDAAVITWLQNNYTKFDANGTKGTFNTNNDTVTFNVEPGYYYITTTTGTAITVATVNDNIEVNDKNNSEPSTPTKKIVSVDGVTKDNVTSADVHVGSVVGFEINGNATQYTTSGSGSNVTYSKNNSYEITDTYANLTIPTNVSDYTVTVNGTATTNFTIDTSTNGTLVINVPLVDKNGTFLYEAKGDGTAIPIKVTYKATVAAGAADAKATNAAGDDTDELTSYKFQLSKVDQNGNALKGAQFTLAANGSDLKFTDNGNGTYTYNPNGTVTTLDMTENTTITVKGLDKNWKYTLHESKVPSGYNQAEDKTIQGSDLSSAETADTSAYKVTVENKVGSALPSTGGMGTTIFYVAGAALIVAAAIAIGKKKAAE